MVPALLSAQETSFTRDTNVAVPMRDGVILRADIWRPNGAGPFPTLVYRTPYGKHFAGSAQGTARKAVMRGYAVVMQDVRGRYASEGEFLPYQQEGKDGFDTIEWAAAQPWSTGDVGTYGLSYPGAVQWLAAVESPPHLKAMVPAMTFASPMQFIYSGGVWDMSWAGWIYTNIAPDRWRRLGMPEGAPWDSVRDRIRGTRPLSAMRDFERVAPWYYDWLRHPPFDPWWDWAELRNRYDRVNAAVLSLSGWHDEAYGPHGAITNFAGLQRSRDGRELRAALLMGPWQHGVPRRSRTKVGAREFTAASIVDYDEIVLRWMDRHVRGIDNGVDREKPVRIFVMGSNRWVESDRWPIPGMVSDTVALDLPGASTTIVSDPTKPIVDPHADVVGANDYRSFAGNPGVVVFETAPMREPLTIVGGLKAELHVSADVPDFDLWVKVYDVAPDGTAFNLMSPGLDVVRASYRSSAPKRELVEAGRVYRIELPDLMTANTFLRGHRLRVAILPSFAPHFSINPHTGGLETESHDIRVGRITVHHDARYPSRLILPVLPPSARLSDK